MLFVLIFLPGILFTGELWEFLSFTERYPSIIYNILLFGLTSALGQVNTLPVFCSLHGDVFAQFRESKVRLLHFPLLWLLLAFCTGYLQTKIGLSLCANSQNLK